MTGGSMQSTYCGMPKGTCQPEVTFNSEKMKPVALAVIELYLSEVSQQKIPQYIYIFVILFQLIGCISGHTKDTFGLTNTAKAP